MSQRSAQNNLCYVLHSRPYQENSLILQCLSRERGIISLLSKGARSSKKQLLSLLQPFKPLSISYIGKGDLYILTGVELSSTEGQDISKPLLQGKSIYCAYYINELLIRLLPQDEAYLDVFSLYQKTLVNLQFKDSFEEVLRIFELSLLTHLGYELNLKYDIHTGKEVDSNKNYYYDPLSGPYEFTDNNFSSNNSQQLPHLSISGKTLTAINSLSFDNPQVQKESKILLRQVLNLHLGDKPLKSREVYKQLYG